MAGPVTVLVTFASLEVIAAAHHLYLTATPRILASPRSRDEEAQDSNLGVLSMDDEEIFGPEIFTVTFAEGIAAGILADYRVVVATIDDRHLTAHTTGSASQPESRMIAAQIAVLKAAACYGLHRIITYHHRISGARTPGIRSSWLPSELSP